MFSSFLNLINHPDRVFAQRTEDRRWFYAILPLLITFGLGSIFPIVWSQGRLLTLLWGLCQLFLIIFGAYPLACLAFFIAGKCLRVSVKYTEIFATWGYSYYPTLSYLLFLLLTHLFLPPHTPLFKLNQWLSIALFAILIAIFLWKVLFYFIELKVVLKLNFFRMIIASFIIGVLFLIYWIAAGILFGMKIPIV